MAEEHEGVPAQARPDLGPPPHWRWEAIAATERPRSLHVSGGTLVFIQDRDTSDVWAMEPGGAPRRLTTGREPAPFWEDTQPVLSPDGTRTATRVRSGSCRSPAGRRAASARARRPCGSTTRGW